MTETLAIGTLHGRNRANYIGGPDGHLAALRPFRSSSAMRASVPEGIDRDGSYIAHCGQLYRDADAQQAFSDAGELAYIVWSYTTPIAAVTVAGDVIVPDVRYSVTTSRHQSLCRAWLPYGARKLQPTFVADISGMPWVVADNADTRAAYNEVSS